MKDDWTPSHQKLDPQNGAPPQGLQALLIWDTKEAISWFDCCQDKKVFSVSKFWSHPRALFPGRDAHLNEETTNQTLFWHLCL